MKKLLHAGGDAISHRLRFSLLTSLLGVLIFCLIGTRYLSWMPWPETGWGWAYLITTYLSHYWFLSVLLALPLLGLSLFLPRLWLAGVAALCYTTAFILMFIDTSVFDQYRFHINYFVIDLLLNDPDGQVIHFPIIMWILTLLGALLCLGLVFLANLYLARLSSQSALGLKKLHFLLLGLLLASHLIHAWADANLVKDVVRQARFYPLLLPTTAQSFMEKHGLVDLEARNANMLETGENSPGDIHYPKNPLQCSPQEETQPNLLLIAVDSWRADTLTPEITPAVHRFAQRNGLIFNRHFSGSNSTRAGLFSMFYGIPGTYWHAFLASGIPSPLITQLQNFDYELGIFAAARLTSPEFDRTIFATVENLRLGSTGSTPAERDLDLTEGWLSWLDNHQRQNPAKPFFGFLFYDAPHGFSYPDGFAAPFQPAWETVNYFSLNNDFDPEPFLNRYRNAVHYDDQLIGRVLDDLEERGLLENTWVIITGDHGQEFNDLKQNYWGHNSNFSKYQLQVPFVIHAPGHRNGEVDTLTTHYDLLPTLLSELLNCTNDSTDYSVGRSLLSTDFEAREIFMAASYSSYAIIGPEEIVSIDSLGRYSVLDPDYREIRNARLPDWARAATRLLFEFYSARD